MNPNESSDERAIRALMESLPMSPTAPETLKQKLVDLAASPAPRPRTVRRPLFAFAMGGATVVAAIAMITALPSTARSWEGVKRAVANVRSMELIVTSLRDRRTTAHMKIDPNSVLVRFEDGEFLYIGDGLVRTYDKSDNLLLDVTVPSDGPNIRGEVLKELTIVKILSDYESRYGTRNIQIGKTRLLQGREVYDVKLVEPESGEYGNVVVDAATDFPIVIEAFEMRNGRVEKSIEIATRFNEAAGEVTSPPTTPEGARYDKIPVSRLIDENNGKLPRLNFDIKRLLRQ